MISEKEQRWVRRMENAGLFPPQRAAAAAAGPPQGAYSITVFGDGTALLQINKVAVSYAVALEIVRLTGVDRVSVDLDLLMGKT